MLESQTFIFFGLSGAGKGTQTKLLADYLHKIDRSNDVLYLSTGALFRSFMGSGTYTGNKVKEILDEGGLIPEFLPIWLWTGYLNDSIKTNKEHIILDGVARRVAEAPVLNSALRFYNREEQAHVIFISISRERAVERLLARGRYDDNREDINARLDWFDGNVLPAIDYFKKESGARYHEINGEGSVEDVHQSILKAVRI
ncbi:MAG TPA: nucleoside monophosphate kinase [Candidatus Paceibacterota bacterium]